MTAFELQNQEFSNFRFLGIGKPTKKQVERKEKRKEFDKQLKSDLKSGNFKKIGKAVVNRMQVWNPAAAIPRGAALILFRANLAGVSTRLYPAFLTESELKAKHFDLANAEKARTAWKKVADLWFKLGGNPKGLQNEISKAHDRPIFKTKKSKARKRSESGFDGELEELLTPYYDEITSKSGYSNYTDAGVTEAITIGGAVLGVVGEIVSKSGAKKNPYQAGTPSATALDTQIANSDTTLPSADESKLKSITDAAADDLKKGLPLDDGNNDGKSDHILGVPRGLFIGGATIGGLLLIWGGYKLYQKINKNKK